MADKPETTRAASPPVVDKLQQLHEESVKKRSDATADNANGVAKLESDTVTKDEPDETTDNKKKVAESKAKTYDSSRQKKFGQKSRPNNKNEFENLPETDDPAEIRAQVEFYFSNANLRTDEHLFYEIQGTKNRPVSIKHLHTFKRMRRFRPYSAVVRALRDSDQLVVFDDGDYAGAGNEAVARKEVIDVPIMTRENGAPTSNDNLTVHEEFNRMRLHNKNAMEASLYVNNFGPADNAGQIAIEKFFQPWGGVMVRRRLRDDGSWKGSVFVEFKTVEDAETFLNLDPRPNFDENHVLKVESKKGYSERKCEEKGIRPQWERDAGGRDHERRNRGARAGHYRGGRGRGRGNRDRDHRSRRDRSRSRDSNDSRDWNGRRDRFQKSKDFKGGRRNERAPSHDKDGNRLNEHGHPVDERGVPKIGDSGKQKRKADDEPESTAPKKTKIEILEDE